jgi:HEAT repeat protein
VLTHAGEEGAEAIIELLLAATERGDRRVYFDTLVQLKAGVPTLIHMLGDAEWFVVRNAAELLGKIGAREAEGPLCELMRHADERVRRSVTAALMRLGTPRGVRGVLGALADPAPEVRMQAAAALATRPAPEFAEPLLRALEGEREEQVQAAYLPALGAIATPAAVERVIAAAEARGGFLRKQALSVRLAAVQGLGRAETPTAKAALRKLEGDPNPAVREAALAERGAPRGVASSA